MAAIAILEKILAEQPAGRPKPVKVTPTQAARYFAIMNLGLDERWKPETGLAIDEYFESVLSSSTPKVKPETLVSETNYWSQRFDRRMPQVMRLLYSRGFDILGESRLSESLAPNKLRRL